ncbi:hypothetical protein [Frankia sp. Cas3]|uniref:hypothetical protein n=1 Tax=Frankia sp. Cas3 TaxID=3073926 RepID=UPI002AD4A297|nr:hypothetical protein [Frankia sp. Cas3]
MVARGVPDAAPPAVVVARITASGRRWALGSGRRLTFGRAGCDIPFGADPQDLMVSRRAGTLAESEGAIVIGNTGRHPLLVLTADGDTHRILSPATAVSAGLAEFQIVAVGADGQRHEIGVVHYRRQPVHREQDTMQLSVRLTQTERLLLVALCEPRLRTDDNHASFATYREIARRVNRDDNYVRSRLATVRSNLAGQGIPGLLRDEPGPASRRLPDYIVRLGEWVLAAGHITVADLDLLA